jgi:hypothetical protein
MEQHFWKTASGKQSGCGYLNRNKNTVMYPVLSEYRLSFEALQI